MIIRRRPPVCSVLLLCGAVAVGGCASRSIRASNPNAVYIQGMLIDAKGKDRSTLESDGQECAQIAQETTPGERAAAGAVAGAIAGALVGALIYRSVGLSGNQGATLGAGMGGLSGAADGGAAGAHDYRTVLRNCMIGRGHYPLN